MEFIDYSIYKVNGPPASILKCLLQSIKLYVKRSSKSQLRNPERHPCASSEKRTRFISAIIESRWKSLKETEVSKKGGNDSFRSSIKCLFFLDFFLLLFEFIIVTMQMHAIIFLLNFITFASSQILQLRCSDVLTC